MIGLVQLQSFVMLEWVSIMSMVTYTQYGYVYMMTIQVVTGLQDPALK